jgi:hypothetical protein
MLSVVSLSGGCSRCRVRPVRPPQCLVASSHGAVNPARGRTTREATSRTGGKGHRDTRHGNSHASQRRRSLLPPPRRRPIPPSRCRPPACCRRCWRVRCTCTTPSGAPETHWPEVSSSAYRRRNHSHCCIRTRALQPNRIHLKRRHPLHPRRRVAPSARQLPVRLQQNQPHCCLPAVPPPSLRSLVHSKSNSDCSCTGRS